MPHKNAVNMFIIKFLQYIHFIVFPIFFRIRGGVDKEMLGILVSYKIKVNLMVAGGG